MLYLDTDTRVLLARERQERLADAARPRPHVGRRDERPLRVVARARRLRLVPAAGEGEARQIA